MIESSTSQRVRLFILEHFIEHASPPVIEQLMPRFGLTRSDATAVLRELAEMRHVGIVEGTARILMAFPFSAVASPFRVEANGLSYFANCAWDAIAFHAMLERDIVIDSYCHHCAEPIGIEMHAGQATRIEPAPAVVYLALRPMQWWEDIITTCSNTMVFFAGPDHRDASELAASPDQAATLTPDQVHAMGQPLYQRKLAIDYVRPGRDELTAHFASLGLAGAYWQL